MDNARNSYYVYYSKRKWNHKEGKDIMINRATFGIEFIYEMTNVN